MAQDRAPPPMLLDGMDHDDDAEDVYPPPTSATSTSSSGGSSQDEGWTEQEEEEEALLLPKATTSTTTARRLSTSGSHIPTGLACRVLRLELPTDDDPSSFLGVEKEELIVTCQLLRGDGNDDEATNVASTRLPTSYRPSKGQICWDQKLDLISVAGGAAAGGGMASSFSSGWRATTTPDAALHFMLWSSSTLLGQAEFPLNSGADTAGSVQRVVLRFTHGARASTKLLGRRGSCGAGVVSSRHHQHHLPHSPRDDDFSRSPQTSSRKRAQDSSLWRRTVSEPTPVRGVGLVSSSTSSSTSTDAHASPLPPPTSPSVLKPSSSSSPSYAWPGHATLVFELLYPSSSSSSSSSSTTSTTTPAPAFSTPSEPTVWQRLQLVLARPSDGVSLEEARLLWMHRHTIIPPSSRALVKLLRALMVSSDLRQDILLEQQQQQQQQQQEVDDDANGANAASTALSCPVLDVLHLWREGQGSLPILDAMKLLSGHFSHPSIRALALEALRKSSDEELGFFLLQLVQLLRYESAIPTTTTVVTGEATAAAATAAALQTARRTSTDTDKSPLPPPPSPLPSSSSLPMNMTPLAHLLIQRACHSPTLHLANALFWYLATEMQHSQSSSGRGFEAMRFAFLYSLREANEPVYSSLCAQEVWFKKIAKIQQRVLEASGLRERKQVLLRSLLSEEGVSEAPFPVPWPIDPSLLVTRLDAATACVYGSTTYPAFITFLSSKGTEAAVTVDSSPSSPSLSAIPQEAAEEEKKEDDVETQQQQQQQEQHAPERQEEGEEEVERRSKLPLPPTPTTTVPSSLLSSLSLSPSNAQRIVPDQEATTGSSSSSSSQTNSSSSSDVRERVLIFKCREDLRQDQLVLQLISLMDTLLKKDLGLDLCLTPYRVLATGAQEGLVEFIPDARTIADILASSSPFAAAAATASAAAASNKTGSVGNSKILAFFREHHPWKKEGEEEEEEEEGGLGVDPRVLDRYIRSCAGYCVMTHLLGIGDRHLHNIMVCPDGRFFHLDFGFILGKDPKPTPLLGPFRLSASMVEGMGGKDHENFGRFKQLCVKAFNGLRRHAEVVLGVVGLMVDAGLKDLGGGGGGGGGGGSNSAAGVSGGGGNGGGGGGGMGGGGGSIGSSVGGSSGGGVMAMMGGSLNLSSSTKSTTTSSTAATPATPATAAAPPPPHHLEAARILSKMEGRFRLDLTNEGAEKHFVGLIHKALGALAPQVIEVLHMLAVKTK